MLKSGIRIAQPAPKIDLLLQEEFKTLFETQARQMELLDDFLDKLKNQNTAFEG